MNIFRFGLVLILPFFALVFPGFAPAQIQQVDLVFIKKNGNFNVRFADLFIDEFNSESCEIHRFYNSKSIHNGAFGYGWGLSSYESFLTEMPDGTISYYFGGAGSRYVFEPQLLPSGSVAKVVETLTRELSRRGEFYTETEEDRFNKLLIEDEQTRSVYDNRYACLLYTSPSPRDRG